MQKENKFLNIVKHITKLLYYAVVVFICLIALFLVIYIISSQLNAKNENYKPKLSIYTIISPSMTPVINVYDVVVNIRPDKYSSIQVGDIITYKSEAPASYGMMITHRVTEILEDNGQIVYKTQGDSNSEPDSMLVTYEQIIGKEIMIIPYIGKLQFLIANKKGWLLLALIPIGFFLIKDFWKIIELFGLRKKVDTVYNNKIDSKKKKKEQARKEIILKDLLQKEEEKRIKLQTEFLQASVPNQNTKDKEESKEYEILDTDEMTTTIKEYDKKIAELEKKLKEVEKENQKENIEVEDDFLRDTKIKVILMEPTKNQKTLKSNQKEEMEEVKKEIEKVKPIINNNIEKTLISPRRKKKYLNLNPNEVPKIKDTSNQKEPMKKAFIHIEKTKK